MVEIDDSHSIYEVYMNVNSSPGSPRYSSAEEDSSDQQKRLEWIQQSFARKLTVSDPVSIPKTSPRPQRGSMVLPASPPPATGDHLKRRFRSLSEVPGVASTPASPLLNKARSFVAEIFTPKSSRASSPRESFSSQASLSPMLEREEQIVVALEILANTTRNLAFLDFSVPEEMTAREFSDALLSDLKNFKEAVDSSAPLPLVQEKEVPEAEVKILWNFAGQILVDEDWTNLFHEMILRNEDKKQRTVFLSPRIRLGFAQMQNQEDAKLLATHLMSECTEIKNRLRVITIDNLQRLLLDDRIKAFPGMMDLVKDAATQVMDEAIRECQSIILYSELKANPSKANSSKSQHSTVRQSMERWQEKVKKFQGRHLDLEGIETIAAACGISVSIPRDEANSDQQQLNELIEHKDKIVQIMQMHGEYDHE